MAGYAFSLVLTSLLSGYATKTIMHVIGGAPFERVSFFYSCFAMVVLFVINSLAKLWVPEKFPAATVGDNLVLTIGALLAVDTVVVHFIVAKNVNAWTSNELLTLWIAPLLAVLAHTGICLVLLPTFDRIAAAAGHPPAQP